MNSQAATALLPWATFNTRKDRNGLMVATITSAD